MKHVQVPRHFGIAIIQLSGICFGMDVQWFQKLKTIIILINY